MGVIQELEKRMRGMKAALAVGITAAKVKRLLSCSPCFPAETENAWQEGISSAPRAGAQEFTKGLDNAARPGVALLGCPVQGREQQSV